MTAAVRVEDGEQFQVVAQAATVKGTLVVWNTNLFGIPLQTAASAANVVLAVGGIWSIPKINAATNSFVVGGPVYWDNTNSVVTQSATSNTKIGVAVVVAANTDTTATVRLNKSF